jgi:hypothetical protein
VRHPPRIAVDASCSQQPLGLVSSERPLLRHLRGCGHPSEPIVCKRAHRRRTCKSEDGRINEALYKVAEAQHLRVDRQRLKSCRWRYLRPASARLLLNWRITVGAFPMTPESRDLKIERAKKHLKDIFTVFGFTKHLARIRQNGSSKLRRIPTSGTICFVSLSSRTRVWQFSSVTSSTTSRSALD